ncbi:hypothetical protein Dimus_032386 [Dionaea muscipula]
MQSIPFIGEKYTHVFFFPSTMAATKFKEGCLQPLWKNSKVQRRLPAAFVEKLKNTWGWKSYQQETTQVLFFGGQTSLLHGDSRNLVMHVCYSFTGTTLPMHPPANAPSPSAPTNVVAPTNLWAPTLLLAPAPKAYLTPTVQTSENSLISSYFFFPVHFISNSDQYSKNLYFFYMPQLQQRCIQLERATLCSCEFITSTYFLKLQYLRTNKPYSLFSSFILCSSLFLTFPCEGAIGISVQGKKNEHSVLNFFCQC